MTRADPSNCMSCCLVVVTFGVVQQDRARALPARKGARQQGEETYRGQVPGHVRSPHTFFRLSKLVSQRQSFLRRVRGGLPRNAQRIYRGIFIRRAAAAARSSSAALRASSIGVWSGPHAVTVTGGSSSSKAPTGAGVTGSGPGASRCVKCPDRKSVV